MKILIASSIMICALAATASADWWHGDDVAYGTGSSDNPCDCAPGEDGIDWNGDGLSNSDDAAFADPSLYRPGTAFGTRPGSGSDGGDVSASGRKRSDRDGHEKNDDDQ